MDEDFSRHVLLCVDAKDYSGRNDIEQHELQQELSDVIESAAQISGFDRSQWNVQPTGDGELAVLPTGVPEWEVIDKFPAALVRALAARNEGRHDHARLRLRLAIHQGLVRRAAGGYAGQGVVIVARMADSAATRQALIAYPTADLVVILSPSLFNEIVLQRHTRLTNNDFREVSIRNKTLHSTAWLHVPGHDVHTLQFDKVPRPAEEKISSGAHPTVVTHIHEVRGDNPVIGIQNRF